MDLPSFSERGALPSDAELVTGSYATRCNAEVARGVLDFDPEPACVSGEES